MRLDQVLQRTNLGSLTSTRTSSSTFLFMRAVINAEKTLSNAEKTLSNAEKTLSNAEKTLSNAQ